jgi:uncharacterized protein (TIGR03437 family)
VGTVSANSIVTRMTQYLKAGGAQYADGGAFHGYIAGDTITPYPMPEEDSTSGCKAFVGCFGSVITRATQMRAVFDQNGLAGKPMFQTEGSWGDDTVTDADTQVAWVARFNLLQAGLRSTLNLQMNAWFTWGDGGNFGWGTIESTSLAPTAAGVAYSQVYNWVAGANLDQPCASTSDGTWTCTLTRPGGYNALAVWNTQSSQSYVPAATYADYRDLAGNVTAIAKGAGVTIGAEPILLESTPLATISLVANAEGDSPLIAPNTWVEIKGTNLANSTLVNSGLTTQLGGVSATVNGKSASVYYVSPSQVNILTTPDAMPAAVAVQVTSGGVTSAAVTAQAADLSPSFFIFGGGPYVAAQHADYSYVGPASLYSGLTTPAKPGETVTLWANGLGTASGTLSPLPVVTIGGVAATVTYAGLRCPGEFQINVTVPASLADGDQPIAATYGGSSTQAGTLLTVQH